MCNKFLNKCAIRLNKAIFPKGNPASSLLCSLLDDLLSAVGEELNGRYQLFKYQSGPNMGSAQHWSLPYLYYILVIKIQSIYAFVQEDFCGWIEKSRASSFLKMVSYTITLKEPQTSVYFNEVSLTCHKYDNRPPSR